VCGLGSDVVVRWEGAQGAGGLDGWDGWMGVNARGVPRGEVSAWEGRCVCCVQKVWFCEANENRVRRAVARALRVVAMGARGAHALARGHPARGDEGRARARARCGLEEAISNFTMIV
jgi:hypothetical protein